MSNKSKKSFTQFLKKSSSIIGFLYEIIFLAIPGVLLLILSTSNGSFGPNFRAINSGIFVGIGLLVIAIKILLTRYRIFQLWTLPTTIGLWLILLVVIATIGYQEYVLYLGLAGAFAASLLFFYIISKFQDKIKSVLLTKKIMQTSDEDESKEDEIFSQSTKE
ncbi:hypothetical protein EI74_0454 [Mycoplasma testudineum]|uniref:Uncharacterized protein n=1 Tax=Mycoplasma testudineum TaxID=244584 RepID=A0A4R6IF29_9MOLU|nr:hypothetical protein [Mycoplasma testudineum]OYD26842.1 hypothetical protein CG473_01890 [Mycoplasma testudineum]TDO20376.1 hypothetical protein EI74_0454 [Mycoplasma testudineum]